jgi:8-oxo-dGTP pyrophosphatase MutT (NUDIX family)
MSLSSRQKFRHVQPEEKLGTPHPSLEAFRSAANFCPSSEKQYTLVLVTEPARQRILLGQKHRGFGKGMFNSFGGKVEADESDAEGAQRELLEEAGIDLPLHRMTRAKVGVLRFTFADSPMEMIVHLFRINVDCSQNAAETTKDSNYFALDPSTVRGCEEISPLWFDDWHDIPLDNMHADDSVWLTHLLSTKEDLKLDGYFHFDAGGQEANQVLHYHLDIRPNEQPQVGGASFTLERRLFHELHNHRVTSPDIKEFKESYSFVNAVRKLFGTKKDSFDLILDVAGGHGALGALFLAVGAAQQAVVIDPADVGGGAVRRAWHVFLQGKVLRYRHEVLQTGLPAELARATEILGISPRRILVVACHACQHLSDQIVEISCRHGVHVAVMPCCQRDLSPGGSWRVVSQRLAVPVEVVMDVLLAGKAMSWCVGQALGTSYDVRIKVVAGSATPQNRLVLCRADPLAAGRRTEAMETAQGRLDLAYRRAHRMVAINKVTRGDSLAAGALPILGAFCLGVAVATAIVRR